VLSKISTRPHAFVLQGDMLISGSNDKKIKVWDARYVGFVLIAITDRSPARENASRRCLAMNISSVHCRLILEQCASSVEAMTAVFEYGMLGLGNASESFRMCMAVIFSTSCSMFPKSSGPRFD